jgi:putative ABC transport system permease protein
MILDFGVAFIDDASYEAYMRSLGLSPREYSVENGQLVAVARLSSYDYEEQRVIDIDVFKDTSISLYLVPSSDPENSNGPAKEVTLKIVDTMPELLSSTQYSYLTIYAPYSSKSLFEAPDESFNGMSLYFQADDPVAASDKMEAIINDWGFASGYRLSNIAEMVQQNRDLVLIINVFTYGFVILIALITVANVFNTISTSVSLRRREFAMLRSVGMGDRSFGKMINFECLFYGLKALLYGLPVAAAMTYLIYRAAFAGVDVAFTLPWNSILISVLGVFTVVFVTMLYATSKVKKANIIDALRDELA